MKYLFSVKSGSDCGTPQRRGNFVCAVGIVFGRSGLLDLGSPKVGVAPTIHDKRLKPQIQLIRLCREDIVRRLAPRK